jgi:hypothetical protein
MAKFNKDVHLTTEFITFLRAGFYGQIVFEGALSKMGIESLPTGYLEPAHRAFDKIELWTKDLLREIPIFATSWSAPETFDAISAMGFMRDLKKDFVFVIPMVEDALHIKELARDRDAAKLLAAAVFRSASMRLAYMEGLYSVYVQLGAKELADAAALEYSPAKEHFDLANQLVAIFSTTSEFDVAQCERLKNEARAVPGDFRARIHDSNILLNVYSKQFTYELAEIPRDEAELWISKKIPAVAAGYWRAYAFSPDDLLEWGQVGINGAPLASTWRQAGFYPESAVRWIREGIPPAIAVVWERAGFEPPRTAALLRRGITDPAKAPEASGSPNRSEQEQDEDDDGMVG